MSRDSPLSTKDLIKYVRSTTQWQWGTLGLEPQSTALNCYVVLDWVAPRPRLCNSCICGSHPDSTIGETEKDEIKEARSNKQWEYTEQTFAFTKSKTIGNTVIMRWVTLKKGKNRLENLYKQSSKNIYQKCVWKACKILLQSVLRKITGNNDALNIRSENVQRTD